MKRFAIAAFSVIAIILLLAGCGGGKSTIAATGRASVTIHWPDRTRLIPLAANSITVVFSRNNQTLQSQTIPRPPGGATTANATFLNLPIGTLSVTSTAYPTNNGTGTPQAVGSAPVDIAANQSTTVTVTMASTIDHIDVTPANSTITNRGGTLQLTATARDINNSIVLTTPSKMQWTSSNTAVATVSQSGMVTGLSGGGANITATDTESGVSGSTAVLVNALIHIPDNGNNRIVRIDDITGANWKALSGITGDSFLDPTSIGIDSQLRIYICDRGHNRIVRMDDMNGTNWTVFPPAGSSFSLSAPVSVSVAPDDSIYVADQDNDRVVRIANFTDPNSVATFGNTGIGPNQFRGPSGVIVGPNGKMYVTDSGNQRIAQLDGIGGGGWQEIGRYGSGVNQFSTPVETQLDIQNRIYVADSINNRIVRMNDITGAGWTSISTDPSSQQTFHGPRGMFIDFIGNIYVADAGNHRIVRIDHQTGAWTGYGSLGGTQGHFRFPFGVAVR